MENLAAIRHIADAAISDRSYDSIVLPEFFDGRRGSEAFDAGGARQLEFLSELAQNTKAVVVGGSLLARTPEGLRNRCHVIAPDGSLIDHYDKQRLFAGEQKQRIAGSRRLIFEARGFRVGVLICADLWWPELARDLCGRIDLLCVPARSSVASPGHAAYARRLWHALALTRAMENGYAVAVADHAFTAGMTSAEASAAPAKASDQRPSSPEARDAGSIAHSAPLLHLASGASTICDPSGRPDIERIQFFPRHEGEGWVAATIDQAALDRYRTYRRGINLLPPARTLQR